VLIATDEENAEVLECLVQKARQCEMVEKLYALFYPIQRQVQIVYITIRSLDVEEYLDNMGYGIHLRPMSFLKTLPIAFTISFS